MQNSFRKWNEEMYRKHPTNYSGLGGSFARFIVRMIRSLAEIQPADTVLEVGCEAGGVMLRLPRCRRLVGVDLSRTALREARKKFESIKRNAEFLQCDASNPLPFRKGTFSVIICSQMLEHVDNPGSVIDSILTIAEPTTRIVLSVNDEERNLKLKKLLVRLNLMHILLPTFEEGTSEWHLQRFTRSSFERLLYRRLAIIKLRYYYGLFSIALCRVPDEETRLTQ